MQEDSFGFIFRGSLNFGGGRTGTKKKTALFERARTQMSTTPVTVSLFGFQVPYFEIPTLFSWREAQAGTVVRPLPGGQSPYDGIASPRVKPSPPIRNPHNLVWSRGTVYPLSDRH